MFGYTYPIYLYQNFPVETWLRPMTIIRWRILRECRRPRILRSVDWLIDSIFGFYACAFALYLGFYSLVRGLFFCIPIVFCVGDFIFIFPLPLLCYGSTTVLSGLALTLLTLNYVFDIAFCVHHISIAPLLHCLRLHSSIASLPPAQQLHASVPLICLMAYIFLLNFV